MRKLTKEEYQARLDARGTGLRLIGEYLGTAHKMPHLCANGHTWHALPSNAVRQQCAHCADRKVDGYYTLEILMADAQTSQR